MREASLSGTVLFERDGRIGRVTLNRPERLNAINDDLPRDLQEAVAEADRDDRVHVIVLAGAGRAFCAGYDLSLTPKIRGRTATARPCPGTP
jgi:enoyl-CoA hydratase